MRLPLATWYQSSRAENGKVKQALYIKIIHMKTLLTKFITPLIILIFMGININSYSQQFEIIFGKEVILKDITPGSSGKDLPIKWFNVNTNEDTWSKKKGMLITTGKPNGVIRTEKQYENFILHVEWKHMQAGGNSGAMVWSTANPPANSPWPAGVEVQMLELDWIHLNKKDGVTQPEAYVHGELFGVGGVKVIPDNPRGARSKSVENRCKGRGNWNIYDVVCVDGVIKLSVNGKFVNGISQVSQKRDTSAWNLKEEKFTFVILKSLNCLRG